MKEDHPNGQQLLYIFDKVYFNILGNMLICLLSDSEMNRLIPILCLYGAGVKTRLAWLEKYIYFDTCKAL